MRTHDARDAELLVFTFKEGLLSKIAHDLKIAAQRFSVRIEDDRSVVLTCDVRGLRVLNAMQAGVEAPELLSAKDKSKIEDTLQGDQVLDAARHPEVRFASRRVVPTSDGYQVQGDLTILGRTREIEADVTRREDRLETEVRLHQPDFGIPPFSALLGTLKVKPGVRVRLSVPAEAEGP